MITHDVVMSRDVTRCNILSYFNIRTPTTIRTHWFIIILPTRDAKVFLMASCASISSQPLLVQHALVHKPGSKRSGDVKCFKTSPQKKIKQVYRWVIWGTLSDYDYDYELGWDIFWIISTTQYVEYSVVTCGDLTSLWKKYKKNHGISEVWNVETTGRMKQRRCSDGLPYS